jgi:ABC-type multidrug transport system fused ATPase/permease subunit
MLYEASYDLRRRLYTHIHSQALAFFQRHRTGELMHRVTSDVTVFEDNAVELFSDLPFEVLTVGGVLTVMALTDIRLMGVVILFLLTAASAHGYLGRPFRPCASRSRVLARLLDGSRKPSRASVQSRPLRMSPTNSPGSTGESPYFPDGGPGGQDRGIPHALFELMESLGVVLVVWYGSHLILSKQITPGAGSLYILHGILAGPVSRIGNLPLLPNLPGRG